MIPPVDCTFCLPVYDDLLIEYRVSLDGFWSHGAGSEGNIRLAEEEGA